MKINPGTKNRPVMGGLLLDPGGRGEPFGPPPVEQL